jgi:hypothetical protein
LRTSAAHHRPRSRPTTDAGDRLRGLVAWTDDESRRPRDGADVFVTRVTPGSRRTTPPSASMPAAANHGPPTTPGAGTSTTSTLIVTGTTFPRERRHWSMRHPGLIEGRWYMSTEARRATSTRVRFPYLYLQKTSRGSHDD